MRVSLLGIVISAAIYVTLHFKPVEGNVNAEQRAFAVVPTRALQFLAMGDPYLAANFSFIRVASQDEKFDTASKSLLYKQVSVLNAYHEDNYYFATALLPWEGAIAPTQEILNDAARARKIDSMPWFYLGINELTFYADVRQASHYIDVAATVDTSPNKLYFEQLSAAVKNSVNDTEVTLAYIAMLKRGKLTSSLRAKLDVMERKYRGLAILNQAYKEGDVKPHSVESLIGTLGGQAEISLVDASWYKVGENGVELNRDE